MSGKVMPGTPIRTRFAPSPTGFLHIGSIRTALYAWLFARHWGGQFILRIEDTDRERSTQESVDAILAGLAWLGLDYDEGPYFQTARLSRYQEILQKWLAQGKAYRCYCSKDRLEQLRTQQLADHQKPRYDGHCRNHAPTDPNAPHVIRFKTPETGQIHFVDHVYGPITTENNELDDLVLTRSDGMPTYHFAVVVDDCDMGITHVIRGDDHINNTPRQIHLFHAMGATIPQFAHLPTILGADGQRLSKRHGSVNILEYRDQGYLPEALLNYLVRLGWSHGNQEIFSRAEMINLFDLEGVNKSAASFNPEKLLWLNQHYLKTLAAQELLPLYVEQLAKIGLTADSEHPTSAAIQLTKIIQSLAERSKTLQDMAQRSRYFFTDRVDYDETAKQTHLTAQTLPILQTLLQVFSETAPWTADTIHARLKEVAEQLSIKLGAVAQPLRVAVTGNTASPPIDITLELIGRDRILLRLQQVIAMISTGE